MKEIIFEVLEDEIEGGYTSSASGSGIHTQGETRTELEENIREAVDCHFNETIKKTHVIHLHFVRDEVIAL